MKRRTKRQLRVIAAKKRAVKKLDGDKVESEVHALVNSSLDKLGKDMAAIARKHKFKWRVSPRQYFSNVADGAIDDYIDEVWGIVDGG